jgi:hypothetical protein
MGAARSGSNIDGGSGDGGVGGVDHEDDTETGLDSDNGNDHGEGGAPEDHQALNSQVNQYFQNIAMHSAVGVDVGVSVDDVNGDGNGDGGGDENGDENGANDENGNRKRVGNMRKIGAEDIVNDGDNDEEDEDEEELPDVDFAGVDLNINIENALSHSFANYNSGQDTHHAVQKQSSSLSSVQPLARVDPSFHVAIAPNHQQHQGAVSLNLKSIASSHNFILSSHALQPRLSSSASGRTPNETSRQTSASASAQGLHTDANSSSNESSKRQCQFCGKTFQHAGSLGRHLDNQKGNELHPTEAVDKLRSKVARRGDPEAIRARRLQRSKEYNRRAYVMEKNRQRRKFTSKLSRVKESYQMKFYRRINHPVLPQDLTFPRMVLFFLPPNMWPEEPPSLETFRTIIMWFQTNEDIKMKLKYLNETHAYSSSDSDHMIQHYHQKLRILFERWQQLSESDKFVLYATEQKAVTRELLGDLTIFDFAVRDKWAKHLMDEKKLEMGISKVGEDQETANMHSHDHGSAGSGGAYSERDQEDSDSNESMGIGVMSGMEMDMELEMEQMELAAAAAVAAAGAGVAVEAESSNGAVKGRY